MSTQQSSRSVHETTASGHPASTAGQSGSQPAWRPSDIRVVLVRPRNPLNMGAAARAMANFGFRDLALVDPYDKAFREARSARAGAVLLQNATCHDTLAAAVAGFRHVVGTTAGTNRTPALPLQDWPTLSRSWPQGRTALLFGSEKTGLSSEDLSYCTALARIPTLETAPSMNLGQAVAICCYELSLAAAGARDSIAGSTPGVTAPAPAGSAPLAERERLVETFLPLLEQLGVLQPLHRRSQSRRLRRVLLRWNLEPGDIQLLMGVARELRRTLRQQEETQE